MQQVNKSQTTKYNIPGIAGDHVGTGLVALTTRVRTRSPVRIANLKLILIGAL